MKTKIESKLIEAFPICDEGKTALRELLGSMGFEIETKIVKHKYGQIFRALLTHRLVILTRVGYVHLNNGMIDPSVSSSFEFIANSFDEYIAELMSRGEL